MVSGTVCKHLHREIRFISTIFYLDTKQTKGMVEIIVARMNARDCSSSLGLVTISLGCSQIVIGEEVIQKLKSWLSPPDPSTNYNVGLCDLHKETTTWFLDSRIFQEWHSTGSLLWIHGKRTFVENLFTSLTAHLFHSRFWEEHSLVCYLYNHSLHDTLKIFGQLRDYPAYPITVQQQKCLCGIFLF